MSYASNIESYVMPHIRKVVETGESWTDKDLHFPIRHLALALESEGFSMDMDNLESAGWHMDWWLTVEKDGCEYTLSGFSYYGGLSFCKDEVSP